MTQTVGIHKILCAGPADLTGVTQLINSDALRPAEIVAVMGKTEGNGCVNDFTRDFATQAWCALLAPHLGITPHAVHQRVAFVMSGGTEGVLSPHFTLFTRRAGGTAQTGVKRLAVGIGFTRDFLPEEMGRLAQVHATAAAVADAMLRSQSGQAGTHDRLPLTPAITTTQTATAQNRGKSETACAASGNRIRGIMLPQARLLIRMPIANSSSR